MNTTPTYPDTTVEGRISPLITMTIRELIGAILSGAVTGLAVYTVTFLLNKFVFATVLCRPEAAANCGQAPIYAAIVAFVLAAVIGLGLLARLRIYRPLLVVIATLVTLWGIHSVVGSLFWLTGAIVTAVLFGISFGLFAWIARLRSFILAAVIAVVVVVLSRLVLAA